MNDESKEILSTKAVLDEGGWNRNFARVLLIEERDGRAVTLIDGNGNGAELELEYWAKETGGGWTCTSSSGHSDLGSLGRLETWDTGSHVVAIGRTAPRADIRLLYSGQTYSREANEFGIWGFIAPVVSLSPQKLPIVVA